MTGKSQPTLGNWQYRPHQSRQIVSETGETVCKIHRGKKAQRNGPLVAASKDTYRATHVLLATVRDLMGGEDVPDLQARINYAEAAIAKAKGETE